MTAATPIPICHAATAIFFLFRMVERFIPGNIVPFCYAIQRGTIVVMRNGQPRGPTAIKPCRFRVVRIAHKSITEEAAFGFSRMLDGCVTNNAWRAFFCQENPGSSV